MTLCLSCEDEIEFRDGRWDHVDPIGHAAIPQCPHTLGPIDNCTICNGREKALIAARKEIVAEMPAQFESRLSCGHEPSLRDMIFKRADGLWVCSSCR